MAYLSESQFVIIHSKLTEVDQVNPTSWKISNACPTILYSTCFPFGFFSSLFFFFGSRFRVLAWIISSPGTRGYSHVSSFFPTNARWWYALYLGLWLLRGHCYLERSCHFQILTGYQSTRFWISYIIQESSPNWFHPDKQAYVADWSRQSKKDPNSEYSLLNSE